MNDKHPVFEETRAAAKLLEEFHALTRKSKPQTENASHVFFDKYYLTMADFLAPIGSELTQPKNENIHDFITSSVHGTAKKAPLETYRPPKVKKLQTIKDFFTSLN